MKISETTSSLGASSTGYSTCQVICWAPARPLLLSTPKSTCKISFEGAICSGKQTHSKVQFKTAIQQNVKHEMNCHVPLCQNEGLPSSTSHTAVSIEPDSQAATDDPHLRVDGPSVFRAPWEADCPSPSEQLRPHRISGHCDSPVFPSPASAYIMIQAPHTGCDQTLHLGPPSLQS